MLTLTETATTVVKAIIEQNPEMDATGLRINASANGEADLSVEIVAAPQPSDAVVEQDGARVFLDETAIAALEDKVLDAQVDGEGAVSFAIGQQPTV